MRKAMIIVSVIIKLLLVVRASFTCREFPGTLRGGNCPDTGLSGSGNNLYGVLNPSRLRWTRKTGQVAKRGSCS